MSVEKSRIQAVDLFCGAGGLSFGLHQAGIEIRGGVDVDPQCRYPFEHNLSAPFHEISVRDLMGTQLSSMWGPQSIRVLAGCAPCQPFSSQRRGAASTTHESWDLLSEFGRLIDETLPDYVTMENVAPLKSQPIFEDFLETLNSNGYYSDYGVLKGEQYGLPQRRRLVLVASKWGPIELPKPFCTPDNQSTVADALVGLPSLGAGEVDAEDPLHRAQALSDLNLKRMRASKPGGTWQDWPSELRAPCHIRPSGNTFKSFYGRMAPDEPSPTITTQFYNYGSGRFGHPSQLRSITPREAAILQGFPREYEFFPPGKHVPFETVGKMIGNAVPPIFGKIVGDTIKDHSKNIF